MEGALKYERIASSEDDTSVGKIVRWIQPNTRVLEMGPATGVMTRLLKEEKHCSVTCIEIDPEAAERARAFCDSMILANLNEPEWLRHLGDATFDYVIFADVLEHLYDPKETLSKVRGFLTPRGEVLVSIPNIGYQGVVAELLQGRFDYRRDGLLDETHIRFFTRRSVERLIETSGFAAVEWDRTIVRPEFSEFKLRRHSLGAIQRSILDSLPDGLTYQFLARLVPAGEVADKKNLTPLIDPTPRQSMSAQVYFDRGEGFLEEFSVVKEFVPHQREKFAFSCHQTVSAVRIDPLDVALPLEIQRVRIANLADRTLLDWNSELNTPLSQLLSLHNGVEYFSQGCSIMFPVSDDPHYIFSFPPEEGVSVIIEFSLASEKALVLLFEEERREQHQFQETVKVLTEQTSSLQEQSHAMQHRITELEAHVEEALQQHARAVLHAEALHTHLNEVELHRRELGEHAHHLQQKIVELTSSHSWRITAPLRGSTTALREMRDEWRTFVRGCKTALLQRFGRDSFGFSLLNRLRVTRGFSSHELWMLRWDPRPEELAAQRIESKRFSTTFSVILPVYKTHLPWLREAIESVRAQTYPRWELCVADDNSDCPGIRSLLSTYSAEDSRIRVITLLENGHISRASNAALEIATGEFVVLLDHDDVLAPHALFSLAQSIQESPDVDVVYSDEDKIRSDGSRDELTCKPQWSPVYFSSFMYTGHISAYRRPMVQSVGGFREGYEGSQDYDLMLRVTEKTEKIGHIPQVLYHWRAHHGSVAGDPTSKPYAYEAAKRALRDSLLRRGFSNAEVKESRWRGLYVITYDTIKKPTFVTIGRGAGTPCEFDLTAETESSAVKKILSLSQTVTTDSVVICSSGAHAHQDTLDVLLDQLNNKRIGCVGPLLLRPDGTVHSAGVSLVGDAFRDNFKGAPPTIAGYRGRLGIPWNALLLGAGCFICSRDILSKTRGSYETLQGLIYGVCLEAHTQGLWSVVHPSLWVKLSNHTVAFSGRDHEELIRTYGPLREDPFLPRSFRKIPIQGFPFE